MSAEQLAKWLRFAIRQNEHDMMMTGEELREASAALAAHEAEKAQAAKPTLCRSRCRIKGQNDPWTPWSECSPEYAAELEAIDCSQWEYEIQRLYAAPAAPARVSEAPVAVPLTNEQMCDALRQCPRGTVESLRVRWVHAQSFAHAIQEACAARWGIKLEGGQG